MVDVPLPDFIWEWNKNLRLHIPLLCTFGVLFFIKGPLKFFLIPSRGMFFIIDFREVGRGKREKEEKREGGRKEGREGERETITLIVCLPYVP